MKLPFTRSSHSRLRDVLNYSKAGEVLHSVPDRLADIIERYDATASDPHFRHDIYNILSGSIDIAEALVDETFSVEHALEQVARQLEVLSRITRYLNTRPQRLGFSILIPKTHQLIGQYSTEAEAKSALANMIAFGANTKNAIVVPVKIVSQHAVQPQEPHPPATQEAAPEPHAIPSGIKPPSERGPAEKPEANHAAPAGDLERRLAAAEAEAETLTGTKTP